MNLSSNKITPKGLTKLFETLSNNSNVPLTHLTLNNNDLEITKKSASPSVYFAFKKSMVTYISQTKTLTHLNMASCIITKEIMRCIGEGLAKNVRLQSLNLSRNRININCIKEFIRSCYENNRLSLRHIDFSYNQICDQAGFLLSKGLKFVKTLESLNFKSNSLAQEAGDIILFMVKENRNITKCVLDINMIKPQVVTEIEKQCKANKVMNAKIDLPQIRKEIKCLRKLRGKSSVDVIEKMNQQIDQQS